MNLVKGAYNPSLIRFQSRMLMSYRLHDRNDWRSSLHIAELDATFHSLISKPILPPNEHKDNSCEDARLWIHQGKLHASFTISKWPATVFRSVVGFGELLETADHWQISKCLIPTYGKNDFTGIEKNHLFFAAGEKLYCLYLTHGNEQTILRLGGAKVVEVIKSKALPWAWGPIHGGAICPGENGNLLHFFNARTGDGDRATHRYNIGVAELSGQPPFDMLRIVTRPILRGEEGACLDGNSRYKNNVVFCCGAIKEGNEWLVSFGHNDNDCRIVRLRREDLKLPP